MASLNKVILIGNLGADPELTNINGTSKCKLRLATSRKYKDKDGQLQEKTQWHNVSVWGAQADTCAQYLSKGRSVCVEGEIEYSKSEKDGVERWFTDIRAQSVTFLGGRGEGDAGGNGGNGGNNGGGWNNGGGNNGGGGNNAGGWGNGGGNNGGGNNGGWGGSSNGNAGGWQ
jgi:single-strand DNA-binding protein